MGDSEFDMSWVPGPMITILKEEYEEIESAARLGNSLTRFIEHNNKIQEEEKFIFAENDIFDVLTINFIHGSSRNAITEPNTMVVTREIALKYFGETDCIGNVLKVNEEDFRITGVVQNPPSNTHLKYNFIASMQSNNIKPEEMTDWLYAYTLGYIKLKPGINTDFFENRIKNIAQERAGEYLKENNFSITINIQPVKDLHIYSNKLYEYETPGNILHVYFISIIGFLILIIACLNFINLSTAFASKRTKEVGMRKVVGAQRSKLVHQFLCESVILAGIGFLLSMIIAVFALPVFCNIVDRQFNINDLFQLKVIFAGIILILFIGTAAGSYPAFFLSRFRPVIILSNRITSVKQKAVLKRAFVIFQFTVSVILIICTKVVFEQISFMKNTDTGFNKDQKLVISAEYRNDNYEMIKSEFLKFSGISGASASSGIPGLGYNMNQCWLKNNENEKFYMIYLSVDHDFISEYRIPVVSGRAFDKNISTDIHNTVIINEEASKIFGFSSPDESIGETIVLGGRRSNSTCTVIGVLKDFHYRGFQNRIEPLVMVYFPERFRKITLTVNPGDLDGTISLIKNKWNELKLGRVFSYNFVDRVFDRFYKAEDKVFNIFTVFAVIAVFLSCLGLFSLSSFSAESRTKEIGIRKAFGASISKIMTMLSKEFLLLLILSNILAWPAAYYFMNKWLQNFAYRIEIEYSYFITAGIAVLLIALLTMSFQTIKAATANPVDSLRNE
jgi:putative ABC transport system permease protein